MLLLGDSENRRRFPADNTFSPDANCFLSHLTPIATTTTTQVSRRRSELLCALLPYIGGVCSCLALRERFSRLCRLDLVSGTHLFLVAAMVELRTFPTNNCCFFNMLVLIVPLACCLTLFRQVLLEPDDKVVRVQQGHPHRDLRQPGEDSESGAGREPGGRARILRERRRWGEGVPRDLRRAERRPFQKVEGSESNFNEVKMFPQL